MPTEEAKSAGRGIAMIGVMMVSAALSGLAVLAWSGGWFWYLMLFELIVVAAVYIKLRALISASRWPSME